MRTTSLPPSVGGSTVASIDFSSVLWHCWLDNGKGIRSVTTCSNYFRQLSFRKPSAIWSNSKEEVRLKTDRVWCCRQCSVETRIQHCFACTDDRRWTWGTRRATRRTLPVNRDWTSTRNISTNVDVSCSVAASLRLLSASVRSCHNCPPLARRFMSTDMVLVINSMH